MKKLRLVVVWLVVLTAIGWGIGLAADEATDPDTSTITLDQLGLVGTNMTSLGSLTDPQLEAFLNILNATPTISEPDLPKSGTFWSLGHYGEPPFPGDLSGSAAWQLEDGSFLLDDKTVKANVLTKGSRGTKTSKGDGEFVDAVSGPPSLSDTNSTGTNFEAADVSFLNYVPYGTNLYIAQVVCQGGYISGIISNTTADTEYQLEYTTNLLTAWTTTNWFVDGSETTNWTAWSEPAICSQNLFLRVRSWISKDGSGLPTWWEEQYFGTNVVNPYADPMNDGWNNYEKFINGMNPNQYYQPAAPTLTVSLNLYNDSTTLSWFAMKNPAQSYKIVRYDLQNDQNMDTNVYNVSGSLTSMLDTNSPLTQLWSNDPQNWAVHSYYQIQAQYASGNSAWSAPVWVQPSSLADVQLVPGPKGDAYLSVGSLPSSVAYLQVSRQDSSAENAGDYSYDLTNNILVSSSTNGFYLLPTSITSTPLDELGEESYNWSISLLNNNKQSMEEGGDLSDGFANYAASEIEDWIVPPFLDGRQQLKQNLIFLLRAATKDMPFQFSDTGDYRQVASFTNQTKYIVADLIRQNNSSYIDDTYTDPDPMVPFVENYQFRNFIFTKADAGTGHIETGVSGDYDNYLAGTYPTPLVLAEPAEYSFSVGLVSGVTAPAVIPTNTTRFLCSYPMDSPNSEPGSSGGLTTPYLGEIGVTASEDANSDLFFTMASNLKNYWGLPFLSTVIAYPNGSGGVSTNILLAGHQIENVDGYFYPETAQPILNYVGYNFWTRAHCPENAGFSTTNTSDLLFVPVDGSITVNGYEKLSLQNGKSGVYAYLGQYFTNAFIINSAGSITSTNTGVLSPYGDFFATQPGPVALITMPALDPPYQSGTCTVYCISMNVDKNHDGTMDLSFNGPDVTSRANPMEFWLNSDDDFSSGTGDSFGHDSENPYAQNFNSPSVSCVRDLEDFARLWVCGVPALTNGNWQVTFSWSCVDSGAPAINVVNALETNGGTLYLTDTNTAFLYARSGYAFYDSGLKYPTITTNSPLTLPSYLFTNSANKYFLFEGAKAGKGELLLTISHNGSVVGQAGVWLDLHEITDFYEAVNITNNMSLARSNWTSQIASDSNPIRPNPVDDTNIIVMVHGINVDTWHWLNASETVYKRLYWSGFNGRFATVKWPCNLLTPIPSPLNVNVFNTSELQAYKASAALTNYLVQLRARTPGYRLNLLVHSQGNAIVSEAIARGFKDFDTYILTQGALPDSAYDVNAPIDDAIADLDWGDNITPEWDQMGYHGIYTNFQGSIVNFYNAQDGVLDYWVKDQQFIKPSPNYSYDGTNCWYTWPGSSYEVTDPQESRAMISRSRTLPIGQSGPASAHGVIQSAIDLNRQFGFSSTFDEHSAQWNRPIQTSRPYYIQVLQSINP